MSPAPSVSTAVTGNAGISPLRVAVVPDHPARPARYRPALDSERGALGREGVRPAGEESIRNDGDVGQPQVFGRPVLPAAAVEDYRPVESPNRLGMPRHEGAFVLVELDQVIPAVEQIGQLPRPRALLAGGVDDHPLTGAAGRDDGGNRDAVVGVGADVDGCHAMPPEVFAEKGAEGPVTAEGRGQMRLAAQMGEGHRGVQRRTARDNVVGKRPDLGVGRGKVIDEAGHVDHRAADEERATHGAAARGSSALSSWLRRTFRFACGFTDASRARDAFEIASHSSLFELLKAPRRIHARRCGPGNCLRQ